LRKRVFVFKVFLESTRPRKNHPALLCCAGRACRARRARKQKLKAQLEPDTQGHSDTGTKTRAFTPWQYLYKFSKYQIGARGQ
jgi:hypothetical protein